MEKKRSRVVSVVIGAFATLGLLVGLVFVICFARGFVNGFKKGMSVLDPSTATLVSLSNELKPSKAGKQERELLEHVVVPAMEAKGYLVLSSKTRKSLPQEDTNGASYIEVLDKAAMPDTFRSIEIEASIHEAPEGNAEVTVLISETRFFGFRSTAVETVNLETASHSATVPAEQAEAKLRSLVAYAISENTSPVLGGGSHD